jgi:hypothetical protein
MNCNPPNGEVTLLKSWYGADGSGIDASSRKDDSRDIADGDIG